jgi:MATE family multidrug resistance protein
MFRAGAFLNRSDLAAMVRLATPIVTVQVGLMLMGVVDTMMVGRIDAQALAAVALANVYIWNVLVFTMGVLLVLDPVVAQAVGAADRPGVALAVQRGFVMVPLLTVVAMAAMLPVESVLRLFNQTPEVIPQATEYVIITTLGVLPFHLFTVLRQSLQSMKHLKPVVVAIVAANVANVVANWALIFGNLGFEPMGVAGSGWATVICRWFMALGLLAFGWRWLREYLWPWRRASLALGPMWRLLRLGLPIGGHMLLETGAFAVVAFLMGTLGAVEMAAHQIALNLAALTFMVPMGIAQAAAVLVGHGIGSGDQAAARRTAMTGIVAGAVFMCFTAALFLTLPRTLSQMFTDDGAVIALAAVLLPIAGVFQVFDGLQAVSAGVLRGIGDTRWPFITGLVGFWVVGLGASGVFAFVMSMGAVGLWWGFVAGLAVVAGMLLWRVHERFRQDLRRIHVDHPAPGSLP